MVIVDYKDPKAIGLYEDAQKLERRHMLMTGIGRYTFEGPKSPEMIRDSREAQRLEKRARRVEKASRLPGILKNIRHIL